jgi:alanine-glyoxylate transaminase/serine-glyoxylate transaminase/serine-pyruvate transaminase
MPAATHRSGRHFLQIPGPSNVPDRVLRAMSVPTIDHRGPDFPPLGHEVLEGMKQLFKTQTGRVVIFPGSGTGAAEAALTNTLSPADKVLMCETGHFAALWCRTAQRLGLDVEVMETDWRHGADPEAIEARLLEDRSRQIKAVCVVHNETSTGVTSRLPEIRRALDRARHPALFLVDGVSSIGSIDYRHDEWGIDVVITGSQKGLMLPPGLCFNAISDKALAASASARLPRSYWNWDDQIASNQKGWFPYTPATNLLYGLRESLRMILEEGLEAIFARHHRHAEATRRAVAAWGLELVPLDAGEHSNTLTAVFTPVGTDADALRALILERFDVSLGTGLGKLAGKIFRIGHLGWFNDVMLAGTLAGIEMGLMASAASARRGGVQAALDHMAAFSAD